jgi:TPR repeat protein/Tfp pilus assembly protein PilF
MRCQRILLCVLLILSFAGAAGSALAQQEAPTPEQMEEQVRQMRAAAKEHPDNPQVWGALMMTETVLLNARAQQGGAVDEAALREAQRAMVARVMAEWKAARPEDAMPYLAEMQSSVPPERIDDAVLALLPRFPDDARLLGRVLQILARREQAERASALIEAALERHPERSELYQTAIGFYAHMVRNETRARELATAWVEHQPGNADALRNWLFDQSTPRDSAETAERVERFVAAGGADPARADVCGRLLTAERGAYRDAAVRCLSALSEETQDPQLRARIAGLLASAGDAGSGEGELARSLAGLPPERREEAVLAAVNALGDGQCGRKMSLLQLLPEGGERAGRLAAIFGALHGCESYPAARAAYLDAFTFAPAEELSDLLNRWFISINGTYRDESGLGPRLVPALEERLRREGGQAGVWRALATAYQIAGWDERRAAHLGLWIGKDLDPPSREDLVWLGRFRAAHGGPQAGIDSLRLAWRKTQDTEVAAALSDLLLAAGKSDDFTALADELASGDEYRQSLARLLRARGTLVRQGPEAALAEYQAWVDQSTYIKPDEAQEYLLILGGVRGEAAAGQGAQALCTRDSIRSTSTPTECAAGLLSRVGHSEGALQLLEAAAGRAPDDPRLQASLAWAAEQAGAFDRAESAYRRALVIDPKSEGAWTGLGRMAGRRGDPAEIEALLRQAERARGEEPPYLALTLARAYLAKGRAARAVEVLTALRKRLPESYLGEDELRQAYAALATEAPASPSSRSLAAAAPTAAPATADDLRAAREAESFLLGLGGAVDEAKGRETVKALAERGNPYANVRLAVWQQAGTQGFTADPRQAAATVAPHLPAVHAAAEAGEPFAQYLWGTVLLRGLGVPKQAAEGGDWLRKAAERNEPWALHNLGWMAEHGDGAERDLGEAVRWYRRGAEAGNPFSMQSLATLRLGEEPGVREPVEGAQWLGKAAERGLPQAVSWYAALQLYGVPGVAADPVKARPWLEKAAALGEVRALYDLGRELLVGAGGPVDERRGVAFLEQAAGRGNARAAWQLAWQTALGRGALHDAARAGQWIERAAALGFDEPGYILGSADDDDEPARRHFASGLRALERLAASGDAFAGGLLARLYSVGIGVAMDPARAFALAQPAAAAGSTEAMRVLGWAYRQGDGVEADPAQAAAWWRRGAEGGNSFCMMWYSQMLFRGQGGTEDRAAALAWLERSGAAGNAWAVRDLGHLYDEGWHDIPRDESKAAFWKRKALAFDDQEARGWLLAHHLPE